MCVCLYKFNLAYTCLDLTFAGYIPDLQRSKLMEIWETTIEEVHVQ